MTKSYSCAAEKIIILKNIYKNYIYTQRAIWKLSEYNCIVTQIVNVSQGRHFVEWDYDAVSLFSWHFSSLLIPRGRVLARSRRFRVFGTLQQIYREKRIPSGTASRPFRRFRLPVLSRTVSGRRRRHPTMNWLLSSQRWGRSMESQWLSRCSIRCRQTETEKCKTKLNKVECNKRERVTLVIRLGMF